MAALTMTPPAVRQPFASLDSPRMRPLLRTKMNTKNQQNRAIMASKKKSLLDSEDSENIDPIDPTTCKPSTKRKRAVYDEDEDEDSHESVKSPMKPMKTSRMVLNIIDSNSISSTPSNPLKAPPSTPKSAPTLRPAGRSPQMKACKPFARRTFAKNRPESANRRSVRRPFSIAAALSNGKSKAQPTPAPRTPASWSFDIYVDSEEEEMTNLMQHSTCVLDISDDEGKQDRETTHRGKENIPPSELGISVPSSRQQESPAAAARKSVMEEESRSPLGELHAADYYGEDCHAFSYVVVYDDDETPALIEQKKTAVPFPCPTHPARTKLSSVSSIASVLEAASPKATVETKNSEFEIWESESATDEAASA